MAISSTSRILASTTITKRAWLIAGSISCPKRSSCGAHPSRHLFSGKCHSSSAWRRRCATCCGPRSRGGSGRSDMGICILLFLQEPIKDCALSLQSPASPPSWSVCLMMPRCRNFQSFCYFFCACNHIRTHVEKLLIL